MEDTETTALTDADEVEQHPCPRCLAEPGSPCRSRSGAVAGSYHTGRFTKVSRLAKELRGPTRPTAGRASRGGRSPESTTPRAPAGCCSGSSPRWPKPTGRPSANPPWRVLIRALPTYLIGVGFRPEPVPAFARRPSEPAAPFA